MLNLYGLYLLAYRRCDIAPIHSAKEYLMKNNCVTKVAAALGRPAGVLCHGADLALD
jgi:hypothetical protein